MPGLIPYDIFKLVQFALPVMWKRAHLSIISATVIGLVWSITAFSFVWNWENSLADKELVADAERYISAVQNGFADYLDKLKALRALFEAEGNVSRAEFEIFARALLRDEAAIQNLSWVPRITHDQRRAHEESGIGDGLPDYRIKSLNTDNS